MARKKKYSVQISSVAYDDILNHFYFLARVSVPAANRLKAALLKDIRSLADMPDRHPAYDRPYLTPGKYRYMLSAERYRIVFEIDGDAVRVNGVEDCRKNNETNRPR